MSIPDPTPIEPEPAPLDPDVPGRPPDPVDRLRIPLPWRTTEEGSDAFWTGWARD